MGFGSIGPVQLIIILVIVILIFGTKKLKNLGSDVGGAIKNFKTAMNEDDKKDQPDTLEKKDAADANFSEVKEDEKQKK